MLFGDLPFDGKHKTELYRKILKCEFEFPKLEGPPFVSEMAKDLISRILVSNPKKRIGLSDIKLHPWFDSLDRQYKQKGSKLIIGNFMGVKN